jgi:hypothetical protein
MNKNEAFDEDLMVQSCGMASASSWLVESKLVRVSYL